MIDQLLHSCSYQPLVLRCLVSLLLDPFSGPKLILGINDGVIRAQRIFRSSSRLIRSRSMSG